MLLIRYGCELPRAATRSTTTATYAATATATTTRIATRAASCRRRAGGDCNATLGVEVRLIALFSLVGAVKLLVQVLATFDGDGAGVRGRLALDRLGALGACRAV